MGGVPRAKWVCRGSEHGVTMSLFLRRSGLFLFVACIIRTNFGWPSSLHCCASSLRLSQCVCVCVCVCVCEHRGGFSCSPLHCSFHCATALCIFTASGMALMRRAWHGSAWARGRCRTTACGWRSGVSMISKRAPFGVTHTLQCRGRCCGAHVTMLLMPLMLLVLQPDARACAQPQHTHVVTARSRCGCSKPTV